MHKDRLKLLVMIPNFGTEHREYLDRILLEYSKFEDIDVDIVLFSTVETTNIIKNINCIEYVYPDLGKELSYKPREYAFEHINAYDLYMHQENDVLITENNIKTFIIGQDRSNYEYTKDHVRGFIIFEEKDREKCFISTGGSSGVIENNIFTTYNIHQTGWLLTNDQLNIVSTRDISYGTDLEDSCSNFFYSENHPYGRKNGLYKKIYGDLIEGSLIEHLPKKYIHYNNCDYQTLTQALALIKQ